MTAPAISQVLPMLHVGQPLRPHDLWFTREAWPLEWPVLVPLLVVSVWYARGVHALWMHAGTGRGVSRWRVGCFAAGLITTALALLTPLAAMGGALFSMHMVQHVLLMLVAAPLLVLGTPSRVFAWALPRSRRTSYGAVVSHGAVRGAWRWLTRPVVAWLLHAVIVLAWHHPALFQRTLQSEWVHVTQHVTFFGSALVYWAALGVQGGTSRLPIPAGVLYLFTTGIYGAALGALFTVSRELFYPAYARSAIAWGITPLQDQQLAGLVMWVPAGFVYVGAAVWLLSVMLRDQRSAPAWSATVARRGVRAAAVVVALVSPLLLSACDRATPLQTATLIPGADVARGKRALKDHGCGGCHIIPGVPGATGRVGPPLSQLTRRMVIAGRLPNSPDAIIAFMVRPDAIDPQTLMPVTGITEQEARDATAYLLQLR
jgi:putative membrane protein